MQAEYASVNHMVDGEIPVVGVRFLGGSDQWAKAHERRTVKLIFGMGVLVSCGWVEGAGLELWVEGRGFDGLWGR